MLDIATAEELDIFTNNPEVEINNTAPKARGADNLMMRWKMFKPLKGKTSPLQMMRVQSP